VSQSGENDIQCKSYLPVNFLKRNRTCVGVDKWPTDECQGVAGVLVEYRLENLRGDNDLHSHPFRSIRISDQHWVDIHSNKNGWIYRVLYSKHSAGYNTCRGLNVRLIIKSSSTIGSDRQPRHRELSSKDWLKKAMVTFEPQASAPSTPHLAAHAGSTKQLAWYPYNLKRAQHLLL
jgi:hypothetical protein